MQKEIHPKYNTEAQVLCACGNKFTVGSTLDKVEVEVCSDCHPFFTGQEKVMDTAGRVEKFKTRQSKAKPVKTPKKATASKTKDKK